MSKQKTVTKYTAVTVLLVIAFLSAVVRPLAILVCADTDVLTDGMTTNIPDTDIGGETGGMNTEGSPPLDSESIVTDNGTSVTTPSASSSVTSVPKSTTATSPKQTTVPVTTQTPVDTGDSNVWIAAVIVVALIAAVIIAVIAFMPKRSDR